MKNLKRVLSLGLASVMLLGMMVVGASAVDAKDFTDASEITNSEAVSTMTALEIIKGNDDGSFDPDRVVTRAEMAKMIAVIMNGGKDPVLSTTAAASFTDTTNHWAKKYIEYCYKNGIIAGKGDGTFAPDASVTGSEAAKMALTAMGYDSDVFGFTGIDWEINVNSKANDPSADLYRGLEGINPSEGMSRDNAAQLLYNALSANMMSITWNKSLTTGEQTYTLSLSDDTLLETKMGVIKVVGTVTNNEFTSGAAYEGKTALVVTNYGDEEEQQTFKTGTYNIVTGADEIGKSVTVYLKPYANNASSISRATVIGQPIVNSDNVIYATTGVLVNDPTEDNDITEVLKAKGLRFDNAQSVSLFINYTVQTVANPATTNLNSLLNSTKGWEAQYIDNDDDGIIEAVTIVKKAFGKVGTLTTNSKGTLNISKLGSVGVDTTDTYGVGANTLSTTKASEEVYGWEDLDLKKGDYATYFYVKGAGTYHVEKAEGVTVTVNALTANGRIRTSEGNYGKSGLASSTDIDGKGHATLHAAVTLNEDAILYLDGGNNVIYVTGVETEINYLMITEGASNSGTWGDSVQAKVLFQDGTKKTISIVVIDGDDIVAATGHAAGSGKLTAGATKGAPGTALKLLDDTKIGVTGAKIYSYVIDDDGNYELTTATTVEKASIDVSHVKPQIASGMVANNNTMFVINTSGSTYVATTGIANISDREGIDYLYAVVDTGVATVIFTSGGNGANSEANYMYFLSTSPTITKENGTNIYTYDVISKGEVTTIQGTSSLSVPAAGLYVANFSGTKVSSVSNVDAAIVAASDATTATAGVVANATGSYYYNDETVAFLITGGTPDYVAVHDVESIVTEGASVDIISMLLGTTTATNQTAKYVFVVREVASTYAIADVVVNATTPTAGDSSNPSEVSPAVTLTTGDVKDGTTLLYTIEDEIERIAEANRGTAAAVVKVTVPGKKVSDNPTITVVKKLTDGTEQSSSAAAFLDGDDGTDGYMYVVVFDNTASFTVNDGTSTYYYTVNW